MRLFFSLIKIIPIFTIILSLSSCAGGYTAKSKEQPQNTNVQCHNWCHNGWCSKHCEIPIQTN